jgi:hypothetical protein
MYGPGLGSSRLPLKCRRVAFLAALVIAAGVAGGDAVAAPVTLAAPAQGRIISFAQDGRRIAWIGYRERVHVKTIATGRSVVVGSARTQAPGGGAGGFPTGFRNHLLALAGKQALWTVQGGGNCIETSVRAATLGEEKPPAVVSSMTFCSVEGSVTTATVGDAATLAFTTVSFEFDQVITCSRVSSGRTARVVGASAVTVPGSVPAVQLAVSAGRVAVVPADETCTSPLLAPAPDGTVEIRAAIDGALLAAFSPAGTVRALALSGPRAVVLVEAADGSKRVERYDAVTGALLGATRVSSGVAPDLDIAGEWIVYRTGRAIRLIDAVTGAKQLLFIAPVTPSGLSIESRRVAWAENRSGHGRVRSVMAPLRP